MQDQPRNIPLIGRLEPRPIPTTALDFRGRHRRLAELNRLEQEIKLLTEELAELEGAPKASTACMEVLVTIERTQDALLPSTAAPENPQWNRWFEGDTVSESCCCGL